MINCGYYTLQRVRKFIDLSLRYNLLIHSIAGRDADLVVMVDCQIPSDDLIVHFF